MNIKYQNLTIYLSHVVYKQDLKLEMYLALSNFIDWLYSRLSPSFQNWNQFFESSDQWFEVIFDHKVANPLILHNDVEWNKNAENNIKNFL